MEVRRLTARKEEIYRQLLGDRTPLIPSGVRQLMEVLGKHQVYFSTAHQFSLYPHCSIYGAHCVKAYKLHDAVTWNLSVQYPAKKIWQAGIVC